MATDKSTLKAFFATGARPTEGQFTQMIDSVAHLSQSNDGNVQLTGGVVVGNTSVPDVQGAIKWDGTNFQFRTLAGFQSLSLTGSNPQDFGNVRVGSTLTGNAAVFAHVSKYTNDDFAFAQTVGGTTIISAGGSNSILFQNRNAGVPKTLINVQANRTTVSTPMVVGEVPVSPVPPPLPATFALAVYGEVFKLSGNVWTVISDQRVKKDISPFTDGLKKLLTVKPVWFRYKGMEGTKEGAMEQVGILAQEVKETFPFMVNECPGTIMTEDGELTGLLSFNGSALPFVIVNAIRELNEKINGLEEYFKQNTNQHGNRTAKSDN